LVLSFRTIINISTQKKKKIKNNNNNNMSSIVFLSKL
jgi:hypothetical protein